MDINRFNWYKLSNMPYLHIWYKFKNNYGNAILSINIGVLNYYKDINWYISLIILIGSFIGILWFIYSIK